MQEKWQRIGNKLINLPLFIDDVIISLKTLKESSDKILELISKFSKDTGYKNQYIKIN